jgi:hypothetical protein
MSSAVRNPYHIGPVQLPAQPIGLADGITVSVDGEDATPANTNSNRTELDDGSVVISFDRRSNAAAAGKKAAFYDNLADEIVPSDLARLADELVMGIESDIQSLAQRHADLAEGIAMLGFKLEAPRSDATSQGAPTEGMSRVYHPLLAEAVLRAQANARGELLPAEGPVKVEATGSDQGDAGDDLAEVLESAMNRFFTETDKGYYPDTIRMLFDTAFSGSGFKKCYSCPVRRRPVSESIKGEHFIVADATRDLSTCGRKTHIIEMDRSTFRRMQILGVYRDVDLSDPMGGPTDAVSLAKNEAGGINPATARPEDKPRALYETYAELDIPGFEDKDKKGEPTGLRLPYRVTIDKDSKEVLEVRRNWSKSDPMKLEKRVFVKYPYVEALGFYGVGLFHILCNVERALTAGWRLCLDNGMFANFPAGLIDKRAARQLTNQFRLAPGELGQVELPAGVSIRDAVMGLPYKDVSPAFLALINTITQEGQRSGGTAEVQVGEGRQDAPVGTTLALLEQATKVQDAVHKGMHAAQAEEFSIMKELFEEDPEALWRHADNETETWDKAKIVAALQRCDIVPRADPNTPSHMHRVMKVQALVQLALQSPTLFGQKGQVEVAKLAIETLGFEDTARFLQPDGPGASDPKAQADQAKAQAASKSADADMLKAQVSAQDLAFRQKNSGQDMQNQAADRQANLQLEQMRLKSEQLIHGTKIAADHVAGVQKVAAQVGGQQQAEAHDERMQQGDQAHDMRSKVVDAALTPAPAAPKPGGGP